MSLEYRVKAALSAVAAQLKPVKDRQGRTQSFLWNGDTITLSPTPVGEVLVVVAGAVQIPGDVTRSGAGIVALANAQNGDTVIVHWYG